MRMAITWRMFPRAGARSSPLRPETCPVVIREVVWWCDREGVEQTTDNVFVGAQVFPEIAPPPLINGERGEDHVVTNKCGEIVYLFHVDVLSPVLAFRAGEQCRISA